MIVLIAGRWVDSEESDNYEPWVHMYIFTTWYCQEKHLLCFLCNWFVCSVTYQSVMKQGPLFWLLSSMNDVLYSINLIQNPIIE